MYRNLEKVRNLCNFLLFYLFMLLVTKWIRLKEHVQEYRIDVNHQLKTIVDGEKSSAVVENIHEAGTYRISVSAVLQDGVKVGHDILRLYLIPILDSIINNVQLSYGYRQRYLQNRFPGHQHRFNPVKIIRILYHAK